MLLNVAVLVGVFCLGLLCGAAAILPSWLKEIRDRKADKHEVAAFSFAIEAEATKGK